MTIAGKGKETALTDAQRIVIKQAQTCQQFPPRYGILAQSVAEKEAAAILSR